MALPVLSLLSLLSLALLPSAYSQSDFTSTSIAYDQTGSVTLGDALDITFSFQATTANPLQAGDEVYFRMPRFSTSTYRMGTEGGAAGANIAMGDVELGPSTEWEASWTEGSWCAGCDNPYNASLVTLKVKDVNAIDGDGLQRVTLFKSNGIKAYCGSKANWPKLFVGTNLTGTTQWQSIETSPLVGNGCQDKSSCNLHGTCDYCYNTCTCDAGYGHPDEVFDHVQINCAERTCPSGRSLRDLPSEGGYGHGISECSNNGLCSRDLGFCVCFDGWEGLACDRRVCPNACSGHGICANMQEQASMANAFPLTNNVTTHLYGANDDSRNRSAWDYNIMYSCVCDSSWQVGLETGEWQLAEWWGPDCSLRRCPGGDDPMTAANETNCEGITAAGGRGVGKAGNGCYVECSNRGVCSYEEGVGTCKCFEGFLGENCGTMSPYGNVMGDWIDPAAKV
jgi:hypothetical protein